MISNIKIVVAEYNKSGEGTHVLLLIFIDLLPKEMEHILLWSSNMGTKKECHSHLMFQYGLHVHLGFRDLKWVTSPQILCMNHFTPCFFRKQISVYWLTS